MDEEEPEPQQQPLHQPTKYPPPEDHNKLSDIQILVQEASFQATSDSEDDDNLKRLSMQSEVAEVATVVPEEEEEEKEEEQDEEEEEESQPPEQPTVSQMMKE